jgi:hypothetical protein
MKKHIPEPIEKDVLHKAQNPAIKSPLEYMQKPITHLKSDVDDSGSNSNYDAPPVDLKDVKVWDNFLAYDELNKMVNDPRWNSVLTAAFPEHHANRMIWGAPVAGGNVNEMSFERLWAPVWQALNLIQLMCAAYDQGTEDPIFMMIGDGDCGKWRSPDRSKSSQGKKPDFAGYEFVPGSNQYSGDNPKKVYNRIPGDAKLFRKIRRSMLPPNGSEYNQRGGPAIKEAQKVINQIHDYMDFSESRYGYVVNDEELIFFRRRGTGWGHIDVSPAIRHDVDGRDPNCRIPTTKLVLFYFHMVIGNDESKWRLKSCYSMFPRKRGPYRKAKGLQVRPAPVAVGKRLGDSPMVSIVGRNGNGTVS